MQTTSGQSNVGCGCLLIAVFLVAFVATAGVAFALRILGVTS